MAENFVQEERKLENGWTVWSVKGRIDIRTGNDVHRRGDEIIQREEKTSFDMSGVTYISSGGLRILLQIKKHAEELGHTFNISGAVGMAKDVLINTHLDTLLDAKESLDDLS